MPSSSSPGSKRPPRATALKKSATRTGAFRAVAGGERRPPRRVPDGRWPRWRRRIRGAWQRALDLPPLWLAVFVVVVTWALLPRASFFTPQLAPGQIAGRTVVADRALAVANDDETRKLQERAREDVLPVYDFDRTLEERRRGQLAALFAAGREALAGAPGGDDSAVEPAPGDEAASREDRLARLAEASDLQLTAEQLAVFERTAFATEIEDRLSGVLGRLLHQGVVSDKELLLEHRVAGITVQTLPSGLRRTQLDLYDYLDFPDEVRTQVVQDLRGLSGLSREDRAFLVDFLLLNVNPNLTPNNSETLSLQEEAASQVGTVIQSIPEGKVIVRRGDEVDAFVAAALAQLAGTRAWRTQLLTVLGTILLALSAALLVWLGVGRKSAIDRPGRRLMSEGLLLLSAHVAGLRLSCFVAEAIGAAIVREPFGNASSYLYAVPWSALALVAVLLYGRNVALVLALAASLVAGRVGGIESNHWPLMLYALLGSLAAIYALDVLQFKQRTVTTQAGLVVGGVNAGAVVMLSALGGGTHGGIGHLGFDMFNGLLGGLLAAAMTAFLVPVLEPMLGITTHIKLIELANTNLPLLRRLALEAPGSFQHSLAVANLAKTGCEAIGGDAVLVNTCALYHDVGKMVRPQYYIENQVPGQNPHDKVQPTMSALILINHVKEGLELADAYRLPPPILDAIEQHHGTRLIKYFYKRAQERCDGDVAEDDFRYPGPKPDCKEMGVLMLADAVEAASRTLVDPSRQKLRTMLRAIFDDCLGDHQLDQTDLTLGDLRKVEEAFLHVLTNIYHRRIDYPGFDFNQSRKKRSPGDEAATETRKAS